MRGVAIVSVLIIGSGLASSCADRGAESADSVVATTTSTDAALPIEVERTLIAKAQEMAYYDGDDSPFDVEGVLTTRGEAVKFGLVGQARETMQIYVVQMSGEFVGYLAKVPDSEALPKGDTLYFVMDAEEMTTTGWGLLNERVDLADIGEPFALDVPTPIPPSPDSLP